MRRHAFRKYMADLNLSYEKIISAPPRKSICSAETPLIVPVPKKPRRETKEDKDMLVHRGLLEWNYTEVRVDTAAGEDRVTVQFVDASITREAYLHTIEVLLKSFPQLPPMMDLCECTSGANGLCLSMTKKHYSLIKLTSYSHYVTPRKLKSSEIKSLTEMPQFPHLINMFVNTSPSEMPFVIECFSRVVRRWMGVCVVDILYPKGQMNFGHSTLSDRATVFSKIPALLNTIYELFSSNNEEFSNFVDVNAVGGSIMYNFMFFTEINMIHQLFVKEIKAFMSRDMSEIPDEDKILIVARHFNFFMEFEMLEGIVFDDAGYANMDLPDNWKLCKNFTAFKLHFFEFINDPDVSVHANFATMMMCFFTSSNFATHMNAAMHQFGLSLQNTLVRNSKMIESSIDVRRVTYYSQISFTAKAKRSKYFAKCPTITDPILYMHQVKRSAEIASSTATMYKTVNLKALRLFLASLENILYPSQLNLKALPLETLWTQRNILFPFDMRQNGSCNYLEDVFFITRP